MVDGGSTDGSIQQLLGSPLKILQSILITNKGKGLSHDLYLGMNEVVDKYEYVMTLDGNYKDDVKNIRKIFNFAVRYKIDFTQGSRFRPGGISRNLPRDRYLGIKFFISPLISIFARKIFTDPTNQSRVFSKKAIKYLMKTDINKLKRYDFFFFIPIKLSRSSFLTSEFPVTRSYPDDGTIPTHISKSSYFKLGCDLVRVATNYKKY